MHYNRLTLYSFISAITVLACSLSVSEAWATCPGLIDGQPVQCADGFSFNSTTCTCDPDDGDDPDPAPEMSVMMLPVALGAAGFFAVRSRRKAKRRNHTKQ